MKDFNFNKYIRHGFLLKEYIQNDDEPTGDAEYTSDTEFDIWDQGDESDPIDEVGSNGMDGTDPDTYALESEWEEEEEDLFDDWENLPEEPKNLYLKWSKVLGGDDGEYEGMDRYKMMGIMQDEFESKGYTFDWGLDAEPYGLRKM